ncbi:diguanylate cyclase [Telmatospirillum sp. J64-1]|uniref:GGDEF domain-containing protein n=1 Tax=Telmatospirillum sp. J64-1 TaxID=2502183 RepID=UPI002104B2C5|nr:GGDEF domain-containing protein [Telmatospirillum sp. J64-1]
MRKIIAVAETAFRRVFGDLRVSEVRDLIFLRDQSPLVQRRRAVLVISRIRMVAAVFAILTPLWIPVDILVFDKALGLSLAALRVLATLAFAGIALSFRASEDMWAARRALVLLLAVPTCFFLISHPLLAQFDIDDPLQQVIAAGYAFLPFVMVAGLSVFPITMLEGALLATPLWLANLLIAGTGYQLLTFASHLGALWLLALLAVVATLAGMSQLHFMMQLVTQASHDGLTRAYTRRTGEELLDLQFAQARRTDTPLAVAFIDLDHFKAINDCYGHEEGDNSLREAAAALRRIQRRGDILIRWGGEEFLLVLPNTDLGGARIAVDRLCAAGLGKRPDGKRQTASIGIAERLADGCREWDSLVEKADHRMYVAKQSGRDRVVAKDEMAAPVA